MRQRIGRSEKFVADLIHENRQVAAEKDSNATEKL